MPTNWLKPMSAGTVVSGPLGGGEFQDWLATQANTGLPQKPEDAQKLWERFMQDTGKAPPGFGGGKVPLPDTSKEGILASSLTKMRDVLEKYNDPRWKKFIDAAGINIDKVKAFVNANSNMPNVGPVIDDPHDPRFFHTIDPSTVDPSTDEQYQSYLSKTTGRNDGRPMTYTEWAWSHGPGGVIPPDAIGPSGAPAKSFTPSNTPVGGSGSIYPNASDNANSLVGGGSASTPYRPPQPYKGLTDRNSMPAMPSFDPSAGTAVTTPGTMPSPTQTMPNAPKVGRGAAGPLGNDPLGLGSILPNQGTTGGYRPNRRRYF